MTAPMAPDVRGKRVLVYSLGIEGRDLASWLLARGARVTMSDTRSDAALAAANATAPEGVETTVTGQPLLDPRGFDLVATSQSVLRTDPAIERARELGIPVISQQQLVLQLCRAPVIGITGSSGKTTTTALTGAMALEAGRDAVIGGNIGRALLSQADSIDPEQLVVLEISHTQLQYTDRSPHIAAITNVTPNHLDQFCWEDYVELKRRILAFQAPEDLAVLNLDDEVSAAFAADVSGRLVAASASGKPVEHGARFAGDTVRVVRDGHEEAVISRRMIPLRGDHNVANVVMACAIGVAAGFPTEALARATAAFRGVPHRLEVVGTVAGAVWVNDSIATSPERTIAGLNAFREPVVLLLGGRDKNLPLDGLRALAADRCRAAVCFGEAGPLFARAMSGAVNAVVRVETMEDAVAEAARLVRRGDAVLLSPAGTSFDAYPNFEARGEAFRRLVRAMPDFAQEVQP